MVVTFVVVVVLAKAIEICVACSYSPLYLFFDLQQLLYNSKSIYNTSRHSKNWSGIFHEIVRTN